MSMSPETALEMVLQAAENWQFELTEYIIPANEQYDGDEFVELTIDQKDQATDLGVAIETLQAAEARRKQTDEIMELLAPVGWGPEGS